MLSIELWANILEANMHVVIMPRAGSNYRRAYAFSLHEGKKPAELLGPVALLSHVIERFLNGNIDENIFDFVGTHETLHQVPGLPRVHGPFFRGIKALPVEFSLPRYETQVHIQSILVG